MQVHDIKSVEKDDGFKRQKVTVADETDDTLAHHTISLWNNQFDALSEAKMYQITQVRKSQYSSFNVTSYSQIDEIPQNYDDFEVAMVHVQFKMCCPSCSHVIQDSDTTTIKCNSCNRIFKPKRIFKHVIAEIDFEKNLTTKKVKFGKQGLAQMLKYPESEMDVLSLQMTSTKNCW